MSYELKLAIEDIKQDDRFLGLSKTEQWLVIHRCYYMNGEYTTDRYLDAVSMELFYSNLSEEEKSILWRIYGDPYRNQCNAQA